MLRELQRYLSAGQLVEIIYLDKQGKLTQRKLKLFEMDNERVRAYCFTRHSIRSFIIKNILAISSVKIGKAG